MSGSRVAEFTGSSLQGNMDVFDEKNRALTICAYACGAEASCEGGCGS
jgi:hypothetical protein